MNKIAVFLMHLSLVFSILSSSSPIAYGAPVGMTPGGGEHQELIQNFVGNVSLQVLFNPFPVEASQSFVVMVRVTNQRLRTVHNLVVRLHPAVPLDVIDVGENGSVDAETASIQWHVKALPSGTTMTFKATVRAPKQPGELVFWAIGDAGGVGVDSTTAILPIRSRQTTQMILNSAQEQVFLGDGGKVRIYVPAKAFPSPGAIIFQPARSGIDAPAGVVYAFTLDALDQAKRPMQPRMPVVVRVEVSAKEWEVLRRQPGTPTLMWWNEAKGEWEPVSTRVEWSHRVLEASLSHFSTFGIASTSTPQLGDQLLPTMAGVQMDRFTGDIGIRIPLRTPPGPRGMTFDLALVYSTGVVNAMRAGVHTQEQPDVYTLQAGIFGFGWALSPLGRITVDYKKGRQYLSFSAGSYRLINDVTHGWQTWPQSFWRIEHTGEGDSGYPWTIYTRDGMKYTFGGTSRWQNVAYWWPHNDQSGKCDHQSAREYPLTEIRDPRGNRIVITYEKETRDAICGEDGNGHPVSHTYVRAIRPVTLTLYPAGSSQGTVRVRLEYESRQDYKVEAWDDNYVQSLWTEYRVKRIHVEVWQNNAWRMARRYDLGYMYHKASNNANERRMHSLLTSITEVGRYGGVRPAWTFDYNRPQPQFNWAWLRWVDNGQGGRVTFTMEDAWVYMLHCNNNSKRFMVKQVSYSNNGGSPLAYEIYQWAYARADSTPMCDNFEYLGRYWVRQDVHQNNTTVLRKHSALYYQTVVDGNGTLWKDERYGRPKEEKVREANDTLREHRVYTFKKAMVKGSPFIYLEVTRSRHDNTGNWRYSEYVYNTAYQGGSQYGNWTERWDYVQAPSGTKSLLRSIVREFYPLDNSSGYVVNRVAREVVRDANGTCFRQMVYFYDGHSAYNQPPSLGELTRVRVDRGTSCASPTNGAAPWNTTSYVYDNYGNVITIADAYNHQTHVDYDATYHAYPISTTNALNMTTFYTWDYILGVTTRVKDPNNAITDYEYDQWGRLRKVWRPGEDKAAGHAATEEYIYTDYGGTNQPFRIQKRQRVDPGGSHSAQYLDTWTFYDGFGRTIEEQKTWTGGQTRVTYTLYDLLGRVQKRSVPYTVSGNSGTYVAPDASQPGTTYTYDALDRVTVVTHPDGSRVRTYYQGTKVATLDENDHQHIVEYDVWGRLRYSRQYTGTYPSGPNWNASVYATSVYTYDVVDRLTGVEDPSGATTVITYNLAGWKTEMSDPDMGHWSYAYDAAGNLIRQTDARGRVTCYVYDELNRVRWVYEDATEPKDCQGGLTWLYTNEYDSNDASSGAGIGRRTEQRGLFGKHHWKYDERGRVVQEVDTINGVGIYTTSWTYDAADRVRTMTYPDQEKVTYTYDAAGRPYSLSSNLSTYVQSTTYDAAGRVTQRVLGNNTIQQILTYYSWTTASGRGRVKEIKAGKVPNTTDLQALTYTYDAVGNIKTIVDARNSNQKQCFSYDELDRLVYAYTGNSTCTAYSSTGNGPYELQFTYAPNGNLTQWKRVHPTWQVRNYTYSAGKPHAVTQVGSDTFAYDANGNMTSRYVSGSSYTLSYDAQNRLSTVSGAASATFTYDGDGNKVKVVEGGKTKVFVGTWYEKVDSEVRKYYTIGGQRVAYRKGGTLYFILPDHLGSTVTLANADGTLSGRLWYYPYGEARAGSGSVPLAYRFTGQRWDGVIRLYDYNARYYDPAIGRFIQPDTIVPDPADPQSLNRYAYVNNNPLRYSDPSGHWAETLWDIANIVWDIHEVRRNPSSLMNWGALVLDVGAAVLPVVPGGAGLVVRGGKALSHADEAIDAVRIAGHLTDNAREGVRLVERLAEVGSHTDEGKAIIRELAKMSTYGPQEGVVVLGRFKAEAGYMNYIEKAKEMGATYFNMPASLGSDVWDALIKAGVDPWEVNRQFLDDAIARGDKFYVEANINDILRNPKYVNTYLRRELEYLLSKGYKMNGQWLILEIKP